MWKTLVAQRFISCKDKTLSIQKGKDQRKRLLRSKTTRFSGLMSDQLEPRSCLIHGFYSAPSASISVQACVLARAKRKILVCEMNHRNVITTKYQHMKRLTILNYMKSITSNLTTTIQLISLPHSLHYNLTCLTLLSPCSNTYPIQISLSSGLL
jgi:hypothetical protein